MNFSWIYALADVTIPHMRSCAAANGSDLFFQPELLALKISILHYRDGSLHFATSLSY